MVKSEDQNPVLTEHQAIALAPSVQVVGIEKDFNDHSVLRESILET